MATSMMKRARAVLETLAPRLTKTFFLNRDQRQCERVQESIDQVIRDSGVGKVAQAVLERFDSTVAGGPFKGMKYHGTPSGSTAAPKLVGSYESEIVPWIEDLCHDQFNRIVDVGCAEGYYVVGMALRNPDAVVYGYDIDAEARRRTAQLAKDNHVEGRVVVREACEPVELSSLIAGNTLVICDVEGYELKLLDPSMAPNLRQATMLVELHESVVPGMSGILRQRFGATHDWQEVHPGPRHVSDYPAVHFLPEEDRWRALTELRSGVQSWALLRPNQR